MKSKAGQDTCGSNTPFFVVSFNSSCLLLATGVIGLGSAVTAQQESGPTRQNPSPMVEHTRSHARLKQETPEGQRVPLEVGTLFLPAKLEKAEKTPLFIHFHGAPWLPEVTAARQGGTAVISVQLGSGSSAYAKPFADSERFGRLLKDAESKAGTRFEPVTITAWSAGYGAVREILKVPDYYPNFRN